MKTIEYRIGAIPDEAASEIVVAELAEAGFESFSEYDAVNQSITGWIPASAAEHEPAVRAWLDEAGYLYECTEIEDDTNWNALWESQFEPVEVGGRCRLRAPFHEKDEDVEYEIVIMPKMSFGTGHHATTSLMLERILNLETAGKRGLDMGCGTGVLAILAALRGAEHLDAVDIDRWACENALENVRTNGVEARVAVAQGDASLLQTLEHYDFILANINRNILLADMGAYARALKPGGTILFSGFLTVDIPILRRKGEESGLKFVGAHEKEGWALVEAEKERNTA